MFVTKVFNRLKLISLAALASCIPIAATAQITPDGTTSTTVNTEGDNTTIDHGDRVGDNLFHSFNEFSVPTGGSAGFNNAADIANIFSRVTGSNISSIDGLLSASGAANLYLINPNGIIFGENASLNLGGSFFASTADSLLFEGDSEFSAVNPQAAPLLEVSIPIGASFRNSPGDIINRSRVQNSVEEIIGLEVASGNNLTLLGGNINFEAGNATARGGNVYLGSLSQAGTVDLNPEGILSFREGIEKADISLSNFAVIDVQGTSGGNITLDAQNLTLESGEFGSSSIRGGIGAESINPEAQAGDITINVAENISLDDGGIFNQVVFEGVGNSGNITINTGFLELINGSDVNASTFGTGNAGAVNVTATGDITVDGEDSNGFPSGISSLVNPGAEGDSGEVTISTTNLNLTARGQVSASTLGTGNAGEVTISTTNLNLTARGQVSASTLGTGNAGEVTISTTNLNLTAGGQVNASTFGTGNAGAVNVTATGDITVDGEQSDGFPSNIASQVNTGAEGDSGGVTISTTNLNLTAGGRVSASAFGTGNAGAVNVTATGDITADGENSDGFPSGIASQVNPGAEGDSGEVTISTTNLNLTARGQVSASTLGNGNAGEVTISTTNLNLTAGGRVDANTSGTGNAGAVNVTATGDITADGEDSDGFPSGISSAVNPGAEGDSGGVTISTTNLNLTAGGEVSANTFGTGNAGAVNVTATGDITADGEDSNGFPSGISSLVNTGAEGDAGGVIVSTTNLNLTAGVESMLVPLVVVMLIT